MATLRQYFETDFSNCVKVQVKLEFNGKMQDAVLMYDFNGFLAYFAIYIESKSLDLDFFYKLIGLLEYGKTQVHFRGGVTLPSAKSFPGALEIKNKNPFEICAQFFGDPEWVSSKSIQTSRRIFLYSETDLPENELLELKAMAQEHGHSLPFRSNAYRDRRSQMEKPLAFISHDSRDKDAVVRKLAMGLQKMLCPVWYDEYSLRIGANLRDSIE